MKLPVGRGLTGLVGGLLCAWLGFAGFVDTGWPDRLYLIARGGKVLYKSKPGPFGLHPEELAAAMKEAVGGR